MCFLRVPLTIFYLWVLECRSIPFSIINLRVFLTIHGEDRLRTHGLRLALQRRKLKVGNLDNSLIKILVYPLLNSAAPLTSSSMPLTPASNDPWAPVNDLSSLAPQPSNLLPSSSNATNDPWAAFNADPTPLAPVPVNTNGSSSPISNSSNGIQAMGQQRPNLKTPENFLGENSSLVNLDNLMGPSAAQNKPGKSNTSLLYNIFLASNPFMIGSASTTTNPFAQQRPSPSLNEMLAQKNQMPSLQPMSANNQDRQSTNPFLL